MSRLTVKPLERFLHRRVLRRWRAAASRAQSAPLSRLRKQRARARELKRYLDELAFVADSRLALPLQDSNAMQVPHDSDWAWRPEAWRGPLSPNGIAAVQNKTGFGSQATIFHDCDISEMTLRQLRNQRQSDLAPFGVRMDVFRFDGSFLSVVLDLPHESVQGLKKRHLVRMDAVVETEKPLEIFVRLNVKHGPNTDQIVRELPLGQDEVMVEFDLAYTKINEKRVERMWVDLIFEGPEMNQIVLRDLTFSRQPRAEF
ncbi:DUF6478 family protein [Nereida sp. MMG025]|uniref:DUF6478 family protein n=1 Tax=Nereida sp. MMG025 TaxID=2909981 RepID=UPI001F3B3946|nr:DUF6478 family protein [Nereida sp. MMG025]MCF6444441.1 DUF6478 family protein [Nereida sp. MMG025]